VRCLPRLLLPDARVGIVLFVYRIISTLQPVEFGRVHAAYGGIFIVSAIILGRMVDKKKADDRFLF
jgi:small multidrug resistance family-3 protein